MIVDFVDYFLNYCWCVIFMDNKFNKLNFGFKDLIIKSGNNLWKLLIALLFSKSFYQYLLQLS